MISFHARLFRSDARIGTMNVERPKAEEDPALQTLARNSQGVMDVIGGW
jgi:hypothetical protein